MRDFTQPTIYGSHDSGPQTDRSVPSSDLLADPRRSQDSQAHDGGEEARALADRRCPYVAGSIQANRWHAEERMIREKMWRGTGERRGTRRGSANAEHEPRRACEP